MERIKKNPQCLVFCTAMLNIITLHFAQTVHLCVPYSSHTIR